MALQKTPLMSSESKVPSKKKLNMAIRWDDNVKLMNPF